MATLAFLDDPGVLATVGDPDGTRTVTAIIALLVALGVAMVMITVWLYRTTRPDPKVLAPLEAMGERTWRRADPVWQRRRLDELRPEGAEPLAPAAAPPEIDTTFDDGPAATGFDDLHDAGDGSPDPDHAIDHDDGPGDDVTDGDGDADPTPSDGLEPPPADADRAPIATPIGIPRPMPPLRPSPETLPAEVLAQAMAELDAEMADLARRRRERSTGAQPDADADLTDLPSKLDRSARRPDSES